MGGEEAGDWRGECREQKRHRKQGDKEHHKATLTQHYLEKRKAFSNGLTQKLFMSDKRLGGFINSKKLRMDIEGNLTMISIK